MAFLIKGNSFSQLRSHSQKVDDLFSQSRRGLHVEPGPREQALLAKDPALSRFKSYRKNVNSFKSRRCSNCCRRSWEVSKWKPSCPKLGICYEIHVRTKMREEARKKGQKSA